VFLVAAITIVLRFGMRLASKDIGTLNISLLGVASSFVAKQLTVTLVFMIVTFVKILSMIFLLLTSHQHCIQAQ